MKFLSQTQKKKELQTPQLFLIKKCIIYFLENAGIKAILKLIKKETGNMDTCRNVGVSACLLYTSPSPRDS